MSFNDHFSRQSQIYAKARPTYPEELFEFLASLAPSKRLCWDCGAGSGQASVSLARHFDKVIATDASENQIANAIATDKVEYRVASAEISGLSANSVDLITVATAAHWFDLDEFYKEAQRVSAPKGVLAMWTYSSATINAELDELMEWFAYDYLYDYWPDGRWYVRNKYKTLPFPFAEVTAPEFWCRSNWNRDQWLDYLRSWSSYNRYVAVKGLDPIKEVLLVRLEPLWPEGEIKEVAWPLHMKCTILNNR